MRLCGSVGKGLDHLIKQIMQYRIVSMRIDHITGNNLNRLVHGANGCIPEQFQFPFELKCSRTFGNDGQRVQHGVAFSTSWERHRERENW